jgi:hypothetical protein
MLFGTTRKQLNTIIITLSYLIQDHAKNKTGTTLIARNKRPRKWLLKQVSAIFPQFVHMLNYPIFAILFLKKENTLIYYVNHSENS